MTIIIPKKSDKGMMNKVINYIKSTFKRDEKVIKETKWSPQITVQLKKLNDNAVIPSYAHDGDVCMDLTAISIEYDEANDMYIYHTGLAFASDFNIGQFLFLRSSNCKTDCYLCNHVGIADSAIYRGEIQLRVKLRDSIKSMAAIEMLKKKNISYNKALNTMINKAKKFEFAPYNVGDRVGQMCFLNYPTIKLVEVNELNETVRGDGGFGSTGN